MPNLPTFYFLSFSQCIWNVCLRLRQRLLRFVNMHSDQVRYSPAIGVNTAFSCWFGYTRVACVAGVERGRGLGGRGKGRVIGDWGWGTALPSLFPPPILPFLRLSRSLQKAWTRLSRYRSQQVWRAPKLFHGINEIRKFLLVSTAFFYYYFCFCCCCILHFAPKFLMTTHFW